MKKNLRPLYLFFVIILSVCFVTGCKIHDVGKFVPEDELQENGDETYSDTEGTSDDNGNEDIDDNENNEDIENQGGDTSDNVYAEPDKTTAVHVTMTVKGYGVIKLELYQNIAPITVENFVNLANSGFYDGLIFHRVINNFVIQGGDPEGTGMGGSDKNIKGEFYANGVANNLSHKRGVISMARAAYSYDSASSQFFICHADSSYLDGQYAAFGIVTEGMDVVDKIAAVETDENDKPLTNVVIESVKIDN